MKNKRDYQQGTCRAETELGGRKLDYFREA